MKAIKKFIGVSLILVFGISSIMAQKGDKRKDMDPTAHAEKKTERLAKELSLSETQTAEVAEINLAYAEKIKAVKEQGLDKEAKRSAVQSLKTEQKVAIKTVLTAEQATKFDTMKGRKGGKKGKKDDRRSDKSPQERAEHQTARMTKTLGLTDAQVAQVTEINLAYAEKGAALKAKGTDKGANKTAKKALREEHKAAIKSVLTAEQITAFDAMKKRKGGKRGKGKSEEKRQF